MPNHAAEYEIFIETMHGDGDVYQKESYFYKNKDNFYRDAYLLAHFFSKDCPQRYNYDEVVYYLTAVAKSSNFLFEVAESEDDWYDIIEDFISDYVGSDSTNNDAYAAVESLKFYYWLSPLEKRAVEIDINGKYYSEFSRCTKIDFNGDNAS